MKGEFDSGICSLKLSNNGKIVLATSKDGFAVKAFDLRMDKVLKTFSDDSYLNSYEFNSATFGPEEEYVIAGNGDGSVIVWNYENASRKELFTT
jgi:autophagy-related protein 16